MKYLIIAGLICLGVLTGCQNGTTVTPYKGKILSMGYYRNGDAEVVYKTNNGKYHEYDYNFDLGQERYYHVGQDIMCYVDTYGDVNEIARQ